MTLTDEKKQDIYRKVRGLLRKAEATDYDAEAMLFVKKAQELMFTYAIDEERLWAEEPDSRPKPVIETVTIKHGSTGAMQKRVILNSCAKYNRCRMWYNGSECSVCGFEGDVTFVMMLYASISGQMNMAMAIGLAHTEEHPTTYRNNFLAAFSHTLYDRMRENSREIHTQAHKEHSQALVVSRDAAIEKFMREQGIRLGRGRSSQSQGRYSNEAQAAGKKAADNVDISGGRGTIGGGRKQLG